MTLKLRQIRFRHLASVQLLVILVLVIGIWFRFVNIDRKVYWSDETLTSLRVFGHTRAELTQQFDGQVITVEDLQQLQHPMPEKGWGTTMTALMDSAEHPPLYYLLARLWAYGFGSSVAAMRLLPAVISLLALPCIYWLCLELFGSASISWMAMGIIAVSPAHVLYAQEAREYSLWTVLTLLSSAVFLRALRVNNRAGWLIYGITAAALFYVHILAGLVVVAHGLYLLVIKQDRSPQIIRSYLMAAIAAGIAFSPWLVILYRSFSQIHHITSGVRQNTTLGYLIDEWFANANRLFLDIDLAGANGIWVLLLAYATYWLCRHTARPVWSFILILMLVTALPLVLPDLLVEGRRSAILRYLMPFYVAVQIAVAYLFASHLASSQRWHRQLGRTALAIVLSAGIWGCSISAQAEVWWTKSVARSSSNPMIAEIVNQADNPLLICDSSQSVMLLSLSHLLRPDVHLQLLPTDQIPPVATGFGQLFWLDGTESTTRHLRREQGYRVVKIYQARTQKALSLWTLQPRPRG